MNDVTPAFGFQIGTDRSVKLLRVLLRRLALKAMSGAMCREHQSSS